VVISGLNRVAVPDGDYWVELEVSDLRILYAYVLHRDSSVVYSKLNVYDFMIRRGQPRPPWTPTPHSVKLVSGREVEVHSIPAFPDDRFLPYPFIEAAASPFWTNLEPEVGTGMISFIQTEDSHEFSLEATNRMRNAGVLEEDMERHMLLHVAEESGSRPLHLQAMSCSLTNQTNMVAHPRLDKDSDEEAMASSRMSENEGSGPRVQDLKTYVTTFNKWNTMPSVHVHLQNRDGPNYSELKLSIDHGSQNFFMSTTQFIETQGRDRLERIGNRREEVYESVPIETCGREWTRRLTVIGEFVSLMKLRDGTGAATVFQIRWLVYEDRNSHHWKFLRASCPRAFFEAYSEQLGESRDRGLISNAFFARAPADPGFREIAPTGSYRSSGGAGPRQVVTNLSRDALDRPRYSSVRPHSASPSNFRATAAVHPPVERWSTEVDVTTRASEAMAAVIAAASRQQVARPARREVADVVPLMAPSLPGDQERIRPATGPADGGRSSGTGRGPSPGAGSARGRTELHDLQRGCGTCKAAGEAVPVHNACSSPLLGDLDEPTPGTAAGCIAGHGLGGGIPHAPA
jgi:hypothetical protein